MGCDIHCVLQKRKKGVWENVAGLDIPRYYELFEILAGVKGDAKHSISIPRGFPADMKYLESHDIKEIAGLWMGEHSFSWLRLREILKYYAKHWTNEDKRLPLEFLLRIISDYVNGNGKGVYRIVFGFDS